MAKILVIEDDVEIAELVKINLLDDLHEVDIVYNGHDGFLKAANGQYDLVVLDLTLPGMNGLDICLKLRQNRVSSSILILTSKSDEIDKVLGLETGADDYMTKPFSVRELKARVKAILRRLQLGNAASKDIQEVIYAGDLVIDVEKHKVELNGVRQKLTPKEFEMLTLLARSPGKTFTRTQLLQEVWGHEFEGYEHTVNTHINRLRTKIETDASNPKYILTTWGVGYRFSEDT